MKNRPADYWEPAKHSRVPELLNKWRRLEPERFHHDGETDRVYLELEYDAEPIGSDAFTRCGASAATAIVQAAVQEAIKARRLRLEMETHTDGSVGILVYKFRRDSKIGTNKDDRNLCAGLLEVYLQILEAK